MRERLRAIVGSSRWEGAITALILLNAVTLGLETSASVRAAAGPLLLAVDGFVLAVFVAEIAVRLLVHRVAFFRDPWSVFDFTVVAVALVPASGPFAVLRALRVLRVLRLVSVVPSLRRVVSGLVRALPGMGSVLVLLTLIFYVASVMATELFGRAFPEWFGTLGASAFTLFQIMTLESWSMGIVRPVMTVQPYAWAFFVPFVLLSAFVVLNLFIGVVVSAMQETIGEITVGGREAAADEAETIARTLAELRREVADLRRAVERRP